MTLETRRAAEEAAALRRVEDAFRRRQDLHSEVNKHWLPHGSGIPPMDLLKKLEAADAEFRSADADSKRILEEILSGKRK